MQDDKGDEQLAKLPYFVDMIADQRTPWNSLIVEQVCYDHGGQTVPTALGLLIDAS